jgi:uncharacterized protein (DUF58 family)
MSFGFGRRTYLLAACALVLTGPAFLNPRLLWGILAWNLVVFAVWAIDLYLLPKPKALTVRRTFSGILLMGHPVEMKIAIDGSARLPLQMKVTADVPVVFADLPLERQLAFRPNGENEISISITPHMRGDTDPGAVYLRYQSGLGLAERWAKAVLPQTIRIFPGEGNRGEQSLNLMRSRRIEIVKRLSRRKGLGREFENLREYREGDSLRDICWTATARRNRLTVREYRIERSQPIWIVLDCGRLMQTMVSEQTKLDFAASAALNLAQIAMFGGDRVGLLCYGRGRPRMVGLGRGDDHLHNIMNQLAQVKSEPGEADHYQAAGALLARQSRRSLIVWITDLPDSAVTPEVIEGSAALLARHLMVFCAIADRELNATAAANPKNAEELFLAASATDIVNRRERIIGGLRGRGAHTMEVTGDNLSSAIVREYLAIKERELI